MTSKLATARILGRTALRASLRKYLDRTLATTVFANDVADMCDRHVVSSPYDPIPPGPYPPLYEFVTSDWKPHGGDRDETKIAIVDTFTGLQRTFGDHYRTVGSLAANLHYEMDVGHGDCVALLCPNHVDYLAVPLAVSLTGAMLTPINPLYTARELATVLNRSRSSVLIVHFSKLSVALEAVKDTEHHIKYIIVMTDSGDEVLPEGTVAFDWLRNHDEPLNKTFKDIHDATHERFCVLPYSSGTTGLPKGVCLTHQNLVTNLWKYDVLERKFFPSDHKLSSPLPFFHIYAFTVSLLYTAWRGQTLITSSGRFDLEEYCKAIETYKVERSHLVPPILLGLAKSPVVDKYDLSSLQTIISAAAPLGSDTEKRVSDRIGCIVKQAWGMSELSPLATANSDDNARSGSVGPLTSSTFGKIVDEHGNSLPPNQSGELLIKGPQVMAGYLNEPDKTAETKSDSGWLRTGDVAHYDEDGFFYITDRIKELIKVRGYQVAPAELEALLLTHEAVQDVAVIGKPDEACGELPRAYIVLRENSAGEEANSTVSEDDIYDWVKSRVAPHKRLDGGIVFTDKVPKSASGKILRRLLRDELKAGNQ
ncbi:hypothetical protein ACA910_016825 [Epithemia clementina (nom. ined.)]